MEKTLLAREQRIVQRDACIPITSMLVTKAPNWSSMRGEHGESLLSLVSVLTLEDPKLLLYLTFCKQEQSFPFLK